LSYIDKIAYSLGIRGEDPNKDLAKLIVEEDSNDGVKEMVKYLYDKNKSISSDCLCVLYHVGYDKPELIAEYLYTFTDLLHSKINRMVWGAMIAISQIARSNPHDVVEFRPLIANKIANGTVITNVWGVRAIINMAMNDDLYDKLKNDLLHYTDSCRDVDFATRAEHVSEAVRDDIKSDFIRILEVRMPNLSAAAQKKVAKIIEKL